MNLDVFLLDFISSFGGDVANYFFIIITMLASLYFVLLLYVLFFFIKEKKLSLLLIFGYVFDEVIIKLLKYIFSRPRPILMKITASSFSFPSGHASIAFLLAVLLSARYKRLKIVFYLLAVLVLISRVYLRVHYVSDVLVGGLIGFLIGKTILYFIRKKKWINF